MSISLEAPNGQGKDSRYGWLYYRRVKTQKQFHRPMNRVVHAHLKSFIPEMPQADAPVLTVEAHAPTNSFKCCASWLASSQSNWRQAKARR